MIILKIKFAKLYVRKLIFIIQQNSMLLYKYILKASYNLIKSRYLFFNFNFVNLLILKNVLHKNVRFNSLILFVFFNI